MVTPLRLTRTERRRLWTMFAQQRQAFNFGVAATLQAQERHGRPGSRFDAWKTLTLARRDGRMAPGVPVACQRAGVAAGRTAVKLWHDTVEANMNKVGYWAARRDLCRTRLAHRAVLAALVGEHGAVCEDPVVVESMDRLRVRIADAEAVAAAVRVAHRKPDPVKEQEYCDTKLAAASKRCSAHLAAGTRRLFRSRKDFERNPRRLAALTYQEGAILWARGWCDCPAGRPCGCSTRTGRCPRGRVGAARCRSSTPPPE